MVTTDLERVMLHIFKAEETHDGVDFDADEVGALCGYLAKLQAQIAELRTARTELETLRECVGASWEQRYKDLVREARVIDIGIYPKAWPGKYEERTEYMNGWNAATIEHLSKFDEIVERAAACVEDDRSFLLGSGEFLVNDGKLSANLNDTFAWASADAESVPDDEIANVARLLRMWGRAGLFYWTSKRRNNERSEFKDINRFIDFVAREEALIEMEPSSLKRAYMDLPPSIAREMSGGTSLATDEKGAI